jgi:hypothetical protein
LVAADLAPARLTSSSLLQNPRGRNSSFDGGRIYAARRRIYVGGLGRRQADPRLGEARWWWLAAAVAVAVVAD